MADLLAARRKEEESSSEKAFLLNQKASSIAPKTIRFEYSYPSENPFSIEDEGETRAVSEENGETKRSDCERIITRSRAKRRNLDEPDALPQKKKPKVGEEMKPNKNVPEQNKRKNRGACEFHKRTHRRCSLSCPRRE